MRISSLLLVSGILGLVISSASAGVIVSATRSAVPVSGFDEITFRITGFTPPESTFVGGDSLAGIEGTFSAVGTGAVLSVPGTSITYPGRTTNLDGTAQENPAESYVNFDSIVSGNFSRSPSSTTPTSIFGTWFTTNTITRLRPVDPDLDDDFDQTLLAQIYVTIGANVSFNGNYGSFSTASGPLSFTSVPEPMSMATLALTGLMLVRRRAHSITT